MMGVNNLTMVLTFQLLLLAWPHGKVWASDKQNDGILTVSSDALHVLQGPGTRMPFGTLQVECKEDCQQVTLTRRNAIEPMIKIKKFPTVNRQKRFIQAQIPLTGLPSVISLVRGFVNVKRATVPEKTSEGSNTDLSSIENKLSGIDARLKNIDLPVFQNKYENKIKIPQSLLTEGIENKQLTFKLRDMVSQGILENRLSTATIQGLILQGNIANEVNFAKIHTNIGDLKQFIDQEINKVNSEIQRGYISIKNTIDQSRIKHLVSNLVSAVKGFNERTNLLQSLPEEDIKDEIDRSGGYIEFLESSTVKEMLYDVIYQNLAIPRDTSDYTGALILDLLVHGLQVHTCMLSSVVLSNVYLAGKALEERDIYNFNIYISRVSTATRKMKSELGDSNTHGLIREVRNVLLKIQQLPYVTDIQELSELLTEKYTELDHLEAETKEFITVNTPMSEPGKIQRKPDFTFSSAALPIGSWRSGQRVSYAVQLISNEGLSKIGEWSKPYVVTDKANPVINLPPAENGVTRILYRQFTGEKPEMVAVLTAGNETVIRDVGRDIINAAARLNEDLALDEVRALLSDGADVNITLENGMSPLHYAAKHGNLLVMKLLVNASANIHAKTSDNEEALHFAALFGDKEAVSYILDEGANINAQTRLLGWSPLHIAAANSHVGAMEVLIQNKAFINIKDNKGLTPLHLSLLGNGETMEILLKEGSLDVNAKADGGLTALHYAGRSPTAYYTKQLLKHKDTEVNAVTYHHLLPLHYAAMSGNAEIITELVANGASVLSDSYGLTPLHYAAFYGNKEAALVLSEWFPALKEVKNKDGKTALNLAMENNKEEVIQLLRNETEYLINLIREALELSQANQTEGNSNKSSDTVLATDSTSFDIINCKQLYIKELAVLSEDTCLNIDHIADYVRVVTANIPVSVQYEMPEEITELIDIYNSDIQEAKRNANAWRNQDSILSALRRTFQLAKDFEGTFNIKYDILQERFAFIMKNTDEEKITAELKKEKSKLERKLQEVETVLLLAVSPNVKRYLEQSVRSLQLEIESIQSQILTDPYVTHKLQEYVDFLGFVKDDASEIKQQATTTKQRITAFKDALETDRAKFEKHKINFNKSLKNLQQHSISHNLELLKIQQRQEVLEAEIKLQKTHMWDLSDQTYKIFKKVRDKKRELLENMENITFMSTLGTMFNYIISMFVQKISKMVGASVNTMIDQPLLEIASDMDRNQIEEWKNIIETNRIATENLKRGIKIKEQLIAEYRDAIANDSRHSETLTKQLNTFNRLSYDLQSILLDIPTPQPSITLAVSGVQEVEALFSTIIQALSEMISTGESASTAVEQEEALNSIHTRLSELQCYWKDASLYIIDLRECSENF